MVLKEREVERLLLQRLGQRVGGSGRVGEPFCEQAGEVAREAGALGAFGGCSAEAMHGADQERAVVALARDGLDAAPGERGLFGVKPERRVE